MAGFPDRRVEPLPADVLGADFAEVACDAALAPSLPADAPPEALGPCFVALPPIAFLPAPSPPVALPAGAPVVLGAVLAGDLVVDVLAGRLLAFVDTATVGLGTVFEGDFFVPRALALDAPRSGAVARVAPVARPAVAFRAVVFFAVALDAIVFFAGAVRAPAFFAGLSAEAVFLEAVFLTAAFFEVVPTPAIRPAGLAVDGFLAAPPFPPVAFPTAASFAAVLLVADLRAPDVLLADLRGLVVAMRRLPS